MRVSRNSKRPTRRIATVGALLCSILVVGLVGLGEARATVMVRCSTVDGVGVIDDEAAFNAAANKVNLEACNWIDIAGDISFTADPQFIYRADATSISVSGPTGGATLSGKTGVGPGATHVGALIITMVQPTGVEISNLTFEDFKDPSTTSTGGGNGGALAIDFDSPSTVTIRNSTFRRNRAYSGGALATDGTVEIFDSIFEDNTALGNAGGAVLHGDGESLTVNNVTFVDNSARFLGGAIHASGSMEVIDSIFESNTAYGGGAIYVYDTGSSPVNLLKVTGSTFRTNEASPDSGGAISAPRVEVLQSSFVNNSAPGGGGAISVSSSAEIVNSTFSMNSESNGGALRIDGNSRASSSISFSTLVQSGTGSLIDARELVPLRLVGSVLVGSSVVCVGERVEVDGEFTDSPLNLSTSQRSFVSDESCGGSSGATTINTSYSTLSELGLSATLSTDVGAGRQVLALTSDSVLHSSVPLSLLPSGVTSDQLGLARFASNGRTAAGALRGFTYVAPPAVPEVVPEIPVETVKPIAPSVPAVAARSVVEDGRVIIRGSSLANIGRKVRVMVRLRGTKRFVLEGTKVVNKLGRFRWSPSTGKEAEMYFVVGGVASDPVMLSNPRKP